MQGIFLKKLMRQEAIGKFAVPQEISDAIFVIY